MDVIANTSRPSDGNFGGSCANARTSLTISLRMGLIGGEGPHSLRALLSRSLTISGDQSQRAIGARKQRRGRSGVYPRRGWGTVEQCPITDVSYRTSAGHHNRLLD